MKLDTLATMVFRSVSTSEGQLTVAYLLALYLAIMYAVPVPDVFVIAGACVVVAYVFSRAIVKASGKPETSDAASGQIDQKE